jgi:O-antigen ligase
MIGLREGSASAAHRPGPSGAGEDVIAFRALLLFTVVLIGAPQGLFPALVPLRPAFVAGLVSAGTYVLHCLHRGAPLTTMEPEVRRVLALFVLGVLSVPTSYWPGGSIGVLTNTLGKSVVVFILLVNLITTLPRLRTMLWVLALVSALPAITGVKNYLAGDLVAGRPEGYVGGLTGNPNDLALMLNIVLAMTIGLWLASADRFRRLVLAALIALCLGGIFVTKSRAGFIYLVVIAALYAYRLKRTVRLVIAFAAVLAILSLVVDGFAERMQTILDIESDPTGSSEQRWDSIKKGIRLMLTHPLLGVGLGQDILALNELGSFWTRVHNVYIQVGADLGVPGFIVYLLFVAGAIRSARVAEALWRDRPAGAEGYRLAEGIQISLIGFAIAILFYPVAYNFYVFYLAGLAVAVKGIARRDAVAVGSATPGLSR